MGWLVGNGSWFSHPLSLASPGVPERVDETWFDPGMLDDAKRSLEDPETLCVLLTGRRYPFMERIKGLCDGVGLNFPLYFLREDAVDAETGLKVFETTMDYKLAVLRKLLSQRALRKIRHVQVFDDRESQLKKFHDELKHFRKRNQIDSYEATLVTQDEYGRKNLPEAQEKELVRLAIEGLNAELELANGSPRSNSHSSYRTPRYPMNIQPLFQYTGILLDKLSITALRTHPLLRRTWFGKVTGDHVTLTLNQDFKRLRTNGGKGSTVDLEAIAFGELPAFVLAVSVRTVSGRKIDCWNKVPHITVGIGPQGRAKQSNEITEWVPMEAVRLRGVVDEKWVGTIVERRPGR
jgi:hypothetical protein